MVDRDKTPLLYIHTPSGDVKNILQLPKDEGFGDVSKDLSRFGGCFLDGDKLYLSVVDKGGEGKVACKFTLPSKTKEGGEGGGDEKKDNDRGIWTVGEGLTEPLGEVRKKK